MVTDAARAARALSGHGTADRRAARDPLSRYARRAFALDATMLLVAALLVLLLRWLWRADVVLLAPVPIAMAVGVIALWLVVLLLRGAYDTRALGVGSEEFKRVAVASLVVFAVIAAVGYLTTSTVSRFFLVTWIPVALVLQLLGRWRLRRDLFRRRVAGRDLSRTLVIGSGTRGDELAAILDEDVAAGFRVVGRLEPPGASVTDLDTWLDQVGRAIETLDADAVALTHSSRLSGEVVRRLAWRLEGPRVDLLVAPALSDVAGPRLSFRPAAGLPLIHLDEPRLTGPRRAVKRLTDIVAAAVALLLLSPLLLVIAVLVPLTSRGPVLYVQDRVGRGGQTFRFPKFRTMVAGASSMREAVIGCPDDGIAERYRHDPRITGFGRLLRRFSLDELPQLWSVLTGSMSLVGPRPMLIDELPLLGEVDHRRHLIKPGLTGIWQVSGRKEVAWDERMRMDLEYIETWSLVLDLVIVGKTIKAVLVGDGAY